MGLVALRNQEAAPIVVAEAECAAATFLTVLVPFGAYCEHDSPPRVTVQRVDTGREVTTLLVEGPSRNGAWRIASHGRPPAA